MKRKKYVWIIFYALQVGSNRFFYANSPLRRQLWCIFQLCGSIGDESWIGETWIPHTSIRFVTFTNMFLIVFFFFNNFSVLIEKLCRLSNSLGEVGQQSRKIQFCLSFPEIFSLYYTHKKKIVNCEFQACLRECATIYAHFIIHMYLTMANIEARREKTYKEGVIPSA